MINCSKYPCTYYRRTLPTSFLITTFIFMAAKWGSQQPEITNGQVKPDVSNGCPRKNMSFADTEKAARDKE